MPVGPYVLELLLTGKGVAVLEDSSPPPRVSVDLVRGGAVGLTEVPLADIIGDDVPTDGVIDALKDVPNEVPTEDGRAEVPTEVPTDVPTEVPMGVPLDVATGVGNGGEKVGATKVEFAELLGETDGSSELETLLVRVPRSRGLEETEAVGGVNVPLDVGLLVMEVNAVPVPMMEVPDPEP